MKKDYFEYPTPKLYELKELYKTPYRFSEELRSKVDYIFTHPYNKYNKVYDNLHKEWDSNDMLKSAYLNTTYYLDNPQQFGHALNNIAPQIVVSMWKAFLSLNKHLRNNQFDMYHEAQMRLVPLVENILLEPLLADITNKNIIISSEDMIKKRKGKKPRESNRASMTEGSKTFEYLCGLE